MTLVELLVVVAIIGTLLAISVPLLKPMLESRRTSNAAHVLAGAFQHARVKSIEERSSYGIQLIPFATAPSVSVQLQLQKGKDVNIVNPPNFRVKVNAGNIIPYHFPPGGTEWQMLPSTDPLFNEVTAPFSNGMYVQFNRIGRFFKIDGKDETGTYYRLAAPYENLKLPDDDNYTPGDAMEYCVRQSTVSTWLPPVVMPRRTVVDIAFSGGETVNFEGKPKTSGGIPPHFYPGDGVTVMFTPAGNVDVIFINGAEKKVNETLYFCVGDWDRQVDAQGNPLAEDTKTNPEVPTTYWVVLHPKTGKVFLTENAPIRPGSTSLVNKLHDARKFAREYFFNVGY